MLSRKSIYRISCRLTLTTIILWCTPCMIYYLNFQQCQMINNQLPHPISYMSQALCDFPRQVFEDCEGAWSPEGVIRDETTHFFETIYMVRYIDTLCCSVCFRHQSVRRGRLWRCFLLLPLWFLTFFVEGLH